MESHTPAALARTERGDQDPTLLLLPGWCGDRSVFDPLLDALAGHHHVVSVDWRGHGETPAATGDFGAADLVTDVIEVIRSAGAEVVVPVALSHAGWLAIELRRRLGPTAVPGIVLLDWMVLGPPPPFLDALNGLQDPGAWHDVRARLFEMWLGDLDIPALRDYVGAMGEYDFDMWARAGREIEAAFVEHGSPVAALTAMDPPPRTLHLYAQPSDPGLLAAQQEYAAENAWFSVAKLEAESHFPMFEVPDAMGEEILRFVRGLQAGSGRKMVGDTGFEPVTSSV
jgi:pimeloyl-ACP methyl ester carboxylesterase